ncbi:MAG: type II toxin-antitoxin system VapC family toxin [Gammaproteobacteria bacterium]
MIFVDTSVWSLAFRRKQEQAGVPVVNQLRALIEHDEPLAVPGIVLQELLTGLKEESQFNKMYKLITAFTIIMADESHHKLAAQTANTCRKNGVATTATDCLIAAMAIGYSAQLLTTDNDFTHMANYCDLKIYPLVLALKFN